MTKKIDEVQIVQDEEVEYDISNLNNFILMHYTMEEDYEE